MKAERYALTILCIIALGWVVRMLVGNFSLARYQEVRWAAASFETAIFLGAASIPLIVVWIARTGKLRVLFLVWLPCLFYVAFLAVRVAANNPIAGGVRGLLWLAIAVLFTHVFLKQGESSKSKQTRPTSRPV